MTRGEFLDNAANGIIRYGGNVISWIRDPVHNGSNAVGGHNNSFHLTGEAVDAWFHSKESAELYFKYMVRKGHHCKWNGAKTVHAQIVPPEG